MLNILSSGPSNSLENYSLHVYVLFCVFSITIFYSTSFAIFNNDSCTTVINFVFDRFRPFLTSRINYRIYCNKFEELFPLLYARGDMSMQNN